MSKHLVIIAIVLAAGTVGCAGLGPQQASSLTAQVMQERGLDNLWMSGKSGASSDGVQPPHYAGEGLGTLWESRNPALPSPAVDPAYYERRSGGDLWNPASVVRSWEAKPSPTLERPSRRRFFGGTSLRADAQTRRASAQ